jgi:6-phosphogluconolactonase/glucosamine-6-phosphate isomerase/deaminase
MAQQVPSLLFYSGGSALTVLPHLVEAIKHKAPPQPITFCAVDERFDVKASNFVTLKRSYPDVYHFICQQGYEWIDTSPHLADQYHMANWLEQVLRALESKYPDLEQLGLLGMGLDGHIAGILPFPDDITQFDQLFLTTSHSVVGYDATGKNAFSQRFTLTYPRLAKIQKLAVYTTGYEKAVLISSCKQQARPIHTFPLQGLESFQQPIQVFSTDANEVVV